MSTFEELYRKYVDKTASEQETQQLFDMIAQDAHDPALHALIDQTIDNLDEEKEVPETTARQILSLILQMKPGRSRIMRLQPLIRWYAAAILLLVAGSMAWIQWAGNSHKDKDVTPVVSEVVPAILPARTGAVLTLADGSAVELDSVGAGIIAQQSGTTVTLSGNRLAYDDRKAADVTFNTLTTPRGRLFNLELPDGSMVWLNTESSIKYPTSFTGSERVVELTGEALFEVARDEKKPFRVNVAGLTDVEVLGTRLNINAYSNEASVKTTLLHGSVRVRAFANDQPVTRMLQPGEQSAVDFAVHPSIGVQQADTAQVMAWRNGIFNFEGADIQLVMRQLERWYDIEVVYENDVPEIVFGGKMGRDLTLQQVLRILEISKVSYRLEGKKLIIHP